MDVSNYYPMKELLRDKYFDEGKVAFSLFFDWNIALHLVQYLFLIGSHNMPMPKNFSPTSETLGDLHAMIPGFTDLIGVFAIKVLWHVGVYLYLHFTFRKFWFKVAV